MALEDLIKSIGLSEFLNCILVENDVRGAMLIQSADYREKNYSDPITKSKLAAISKEFPTLLQSNLEFGTLISKKKYRKKNTNTNEKMGNILGYPCSNHYQYTVEHSNEEITYIIEVVVKFTEKSKLRDEALITNVCKDETTFSIMEGVAKDSERILKQNPIVGSSIESVVAVKTPTIPPSYLIKKILSSAELTEREKNSLMNYIYNLGFPGDQLLYYNYEYDNPIHKGILLTLLSYYKNNPLSPFFPLQQFDKEHKEIDDIMEKLQSNILDILDASSGTPHVKNKKGTRKRNL
jgi:hypothetical protein